MTTPRITVGMPLYKGQEYVGEALASLRAQTFADFEVVISVDGGDQVSAEACRPFLSDRRFRLLVQSERLDWARNFNWLLQQPLREFFCYRQHDDTSDPTFFEKLLAQADARPDASLVFSDCQYFGDLTHLEVAPSVEGSTLERLHKFLDCMSATPVRGLVRREAIAEAGLVRLDEFRSNHQVLSWLAKVLRWGSFLRVPEPLYFRRSHRDNYYKQSGSWPDEKKLGDWTTVYTGFLEAALPRCTALEERLFFEHAIMDRVCMPHPDRHYGLYPRSLQESGTFIRRCLERRRLETGLEGSSDLPIPTLAVLQENERLVLANRQLSEENAALKGARSLRLAKAIGRWFRR